MVKLENQPPEKVGQMPPLEAFVWEYCRGRNFLPQKVEEFTPDYCFYLPSNGQQIEERWVSVDDSRPGEEREWLDVMRASEELACWVFGEKFVSKMHLVFLPASAVEQPESKISGGNNVMIGLPDFEQTSYLPAIDYALFLLDQPEASPSQVEAREKKALALHEAWHSAHLTQMIRIGAMKKDYLQYWHPNNIHPLLDEGLGVVWEGIHAAALGHSSYSVFQDENVLPAFFQDDLALKLALSSRWHGGITLIQEQVEQRGCSDNYSAFLKGVEAETIDLLDPKLIDQLNFRKSARLDALGRINPAFVDQDSLVLMSYSVGAALAWILAKESLKSENEIIFQPLGELLVQIQSQYLSQRRKKPLDIWKIIIGLIAKIGW
jgi:hypothetical protein